MKLKEAIKIAVSERKSGMAGEICNILNINFGMNYQQTYKFVNEIAPIDLADWDELLYEFDIASSGS